MCLFAQGLLSRIRRTNIDVRFGSLADISQCSRFLAEEMKVPNQKHARSRSAGATLGAR